MSCFVWSERLCSSTERRPVAGGSTAELLGKDFCTLQCRLKTEPCDCVSHGGCTACGGGGRSTTDADCLSSDRARNCQIGRTVQQRRSGTVSKDGDEVRPLDADQRQSLAERSSSSCNEVNSVQLAGCLKPEDDPDSDIGAICEDVGLYQLPRDLPRPQNNSGHRSVHCSMCGQPFKDLSSLKTHRATRHQLVHSTVRRPRPRRVRPCVCSHCGRLFKSLTTLNAHVMTHTGERPLACRIAGCTQRFVQHSTRAFHERTHSDEMPHICSVCGRRFKHAGGVRLHMSVHTGIKPHQCQTCLMTFRRTCDLTRHKLCHSSERPFSCQNCTKTFKTKKTLSRHILSLHSDEIPWRCSICDKGFKTSGNLRVHLRVHTGDKPFVCAVCGLQFSYSGSLKSHMQTHPAND